MTVTGNMRIPTYDVVLRGGKPWGFRLEKEEENVAPVLSVVEVRKTLSQNITTIIFLFTQFVLTILCNKRGLKVY